MGRTGQLDGPRRVVGSDAGDDLAAAIDDLDGCLDDGENLVVFEGAGFPGGSAGDDAVDPAFNLTFDELGQSFVIDAFIVEGGDDCCVDATEHIRLVLDCFAAWTRMTTRKFAQNKADSMKSFNASCLVTSDFEH